MTGESLLSIRPSTFVSVRLVTTGVERIRPKVGSEEVLFFHLSTGSIGFAGLFSQAEPLRMLLFVSFCSKTLCPLSTMAYIGASRKVSVPERLIVTVPTMLGFMGVE